MEKQGENVLIQSGQGLSHSAVGFLTLKIEIFKMFHSVEPNLASKSVASQSQILWSYGPELGNDGRHETCSYTTTGSDGRWWRMELPSITSIGKLCI